MPYAVVHGDNNTKAVAEIKKQGGKPHPADHLYGQVFELPDKADMDSVHALANVSVHNELPPKD